MKLNFENLTACLSKIDYQIKGKVPNRFIYDHKGKNTGIRVWSETLDFTMDSEIRMVAVCDRCTIKILNKDTVMIGNEKMFALLHNFNKK